MTLYDVGDVVRLETTTRVNSTPTDATTVTLTVRDPAGVDTVRSLAGGTVIHDGTGLYHSDYSPSLAGTYLYRWVTTGTAAGAEEGSFTVKTAFGFPTVTPEEVHAVIASRPLFTDTSKPTRVEVADNIDRITASLLAEFQNLPSTLIPIARAYVIYKTAAEVEWSYDPEQQFGGDDAQAPSLDRRAGAEYTKLKELYAANGGVTAGARAFTIGSLPSTYAPGVVTPDGYYPAY